MATYVDGEAPETDSEDEQNLFNLSYMRVCESIDCDEQLSLINICMTDWE